MLDRFMTLTLYMILFQGLQGTKGSCSVACEDRLARYKATLFTADPTAILCQSNIDFLLYFHPNKRTK
jgi:hypothetical protein